MFPQRNLAGIQICKKSILKTQIVRRVSDRKVFANRKNRRVTEEGYLKIVHHLAARAGMHLDTETLEFRAKQWATRHNGRSGRSARQFIDFLSAELALPELKK